MQSEAMMITMTHLVDVEILQPKSRKNPQKDLVQTFGFEDRPMTQLMVRSTEECPHRPMKKNCQQEA